MHIQKPSVNLCCTLALAFSLFSGKGRPGSGGGSGQGAAGANGTLFLLSLARAYFAELLG